MASTNNAQEQCLDNRMAKLQQRTQDCILLTKMFEKAEQSDDIFIPDADKKKVENGRRVMHVIKETLLVELGCIYPKEMEFPK